jgi:anti-sigma regulatory factor (Ser/Thr protein kinase)
MSVRDFGRWRPPDENERGRGLVVIDALMDEVEIVKRAGGTEVRVTRRFDESSEQGRAGRPTSPEVHRTTAP